MRPLVTALLVLAPFAATAQKPEVPAAARSKVLADALKAKKQRVPAVNFEMVGNGLKLPGRVTFAAGTDRLDPISDPVLEFTLDYLSAKPDVTLLRVEGHTDDTGTPAVNQALSEKRAMAVARWLIGNGVACARLLPVGFGQTKPLVVNSSPANRATNARIEFISAAIRGKPIGNAPVDGGGRVAGDPCR